MQTCISRLQTLVQQRSLVALMSTRRVRTQVHVHCFARQSIFTQLKIVIIYNSLFDNLLTFEGRNSFVGTAQYVSPELLTDKRATKR